MNYNTFITINCGFFSVANRVKSTRIYHLRILQSTLNANAGTLSLLYTRPSLCKTYTSSSYVKYLTFHHHLSP